MTFQEFDQGICTLQLAIGREFPEDRKLVFYNALSDLDGKSFLAAIDKWIKLEDSGFPSIAKIRKYAVEETHGEIMGADEAWGLVIKAVRSLGSEMKEQSRDYLGPMIVEALCRCGGWKWACNMNDENRPNMMTHFRTAWNSLSATIQRTRILSNGNQAKIGNSSQGAIEAVSRVAGGMGIEVVK